MPTNTARPFIDLFGMCVCEKRVSAVIAGTLFFFMQFLPSPAQAGPESMAFELYWDCAWQPCAREAARVLLKNPNDATALSLLCASRLRLNAPDASNAVAELSAQSTNLFFPAALRAMAGYELGRVFFQARNFDAAKSSLNIAMEAAADDKFFGPAVSLCLFRALQKLDDKSERSRTDALAEIWRNTWTGQIRRHVETRMDSFSGIFSFPAVGVTWFYRTQIRSAVGERCRLTPSCSEYFLLAGRQHGLAAFPMIADRLVREPSETSAARRQVWTGNEWRCADPLGEHNFWFVGSCRK